MTRAEPIVFVVDDDVAVREGLASLLESASMRVECFASARDFLQRRRSRAPACLVLDVRIPGLSGLDLQRELAEAGEPIPIIFITGHGNIPMAVNAMKAGAVEFLCKPFREKKLLDSVRRALERDRATKVQRAERDVIRERLNRLTAREHQVAAHMMRGELIKQTAAALGVSANTVKAHRRHIMRKMSVSNVTEFVLITGRLR